MTKLSLGTKFKIIRGFVGSSEWERFSFALEIPPDCRGQLLQLEPATPEGATVFLAGTVWFDDFSIRRAR